jgi:hypothetical protein
MDRIIPTKYRGVYAKAMKGRSLKSAVKAMCYECFGYSEVADNIKNCAGTGCPLYPYRPYQDQPWKAHQMPVHQRQNLKKPTKPIKNVELLTAGKGNE